MDANDSCNLTFSRAHTGIVGNEEIINKILDLITFDAYDSFDPTHLAAQLKCFLRIIISHPPLQVAPANNLP